MIIRSSDGFIIEWLMPPRYTHDEFKQIPDLPNESTLEINVTHHQLTDLKSQGEEIVALSPTRYEEGANTDPSTPFGKGYDITFTHAHEIVFQHKAPTKTIIRGQDNQNKRQWLQYDLDLLQIVNLAVQYDPRQAFLALPAVSAQNEIGQSIGRTIFIDVWEIFARLKQGFATDYILVEYLSDLSPLSRPRYSSDGILSPQEYYHTNPVIRGKYEGSKWAMHHSRADPYYDITFGEAQIFAAQPWSTLLGAYQSDEYGLPIRHLTRTDGGESPDDEWFDIEISEDYASAYREHLTRKYALHQYASGESDMSAEQIEKWLLRDLDVRYQRAIEQEVLSPHEEGELPAEVYEHEMSVVDYLRSLQSTRDPIRYRLSRTKRYVHQSGEESESTLTV